MPSSSKLPSNSGKDGRMKIESRIYPKRTLRNCSMTFTIRSPGNVDNAELSLPHRLLALLLKRNFLLDYESTEPGVVSKLLSGEEYRIKLRPEATEKLVFLKARPRGLSLVEDEPMSAHALSDYLNKSSRSAGLISPRGAMSATFYAWRQSAANKLDEVTDTATTRTVMHHEAGSSVFETHYSNKVDRIDLWAIATGETSAVAASHDDAAAG